MIQREIYKLRSSRAQDQLDGYNGFVISEKEINDILQENQKKANADDEVCDDIEIKRFNISFAELENRINERKTASINAGIYLPLVWLAKIFQLTPFEIDCILICLAPEIDRRYERLYGYLQNDITQKYPTMDMIKSLCCLSEEEKQRIRSYFLPQSRLIKYRLIAISNDHLEKMPLISCPLKLDSRIINFIHDINLLDARLEDSATILRCQKRLMDVDLSHEQQEKIYNFITLFKKVQWSENVMELNTCAFIGKNHFLKKLTAEAICEALDINLLIYDLDKAIISNFSLNESFALLFREAYLQGAAIYIEKYDQLLQQNDKCAHAKNTLAQIRQQFACLVFLSIESHWLPLGLDDQFDIISFEFSMPSFASRKKIWESQLQSLSLTSCGINTDVLANTFRFTGDQIRNSICAAKNMALLKKRNPQDVSMLDFYRACRAQSNQKLTELSLKITPLYNWDDIVLPHDTIAQLREVCNQVRSRNIVYSDWGFDKKLSYGKGLNILFTGPSGTGKTMATEIIARELSIDLYKIDLSSVVSKYIGETEKNLNRIFAEAEQSNAILFFDEADALFGKRSEVRDSHDRYANIEINYLLQKMEEHEGIVILASNLRQNIDEAFIRRMQIVVEFPFPDESHRHRIWQHVFPSDAPLSKKNDFNFLAKNLQLSGGNIKNIALCAAFLAAENSGVIDMHHIILATRREFQKIGKLCGKAEFGPYYEFIREKNESKGAGE